MPNEFDFIDWVRTRQSPSDRVILPAGDDLAILSGVPDALLVGIDQILDGVHFDSATHSPAAIGRKAMNRNLSDCAAMACLPLAAVVSLAMPRDLPATFAKELYEGMRTAGEKLGCAIVGGDTGAWAGKLAISVAILGRSDGVTPVRRSGAHAGDLVYVTGALGGSILARHMDFTPRIDEARALVSAHRITAMIDLSDGLSRDLAHICRESGVGAVIDADSVPVHADVARLPASNRTPLEHALHDGEDYELCFTSPDEVPSATRIGRIVSGHEIMLAQHGRKSPLVPLGFEHAF